MNNGIIKRMCVLLAIAFAGMTQGVQAQSVAVKSNVLADAFLNPNLGIEVGLAPKWTLDVTGQLTRGCSRTIGTGNTGLFNPKPDTGSATAFRGTLLALTFMADSIISAVLTEKSTSSARMPAS